MLANRKLYLITVKVQENCLLKAARAFLVFKAIEEFGDIIAADPSTQDIEDEKFDFIFRLVVLQTVRLILFSRQSRLYPR